ncbi:hypothetical protein [Microbacterium trichothecenolyticum]|uniref:Septal ring-binding cell division protein DamX n=1 Tax=Microbacterium trichothecenolyticum TaxID=69370 RepID=A0ABU0TT46_MICTR|nr:hypothetical protein [Microbacterium trichothecenolyticum]MDQ1122846.1 septal ring-binding cell division protein DamX [Microbacterium trichothecenolyticum]
MIRRTAPLAGLLVAGALMLASCATPSPTVWQSTVEAVASQAAAGDYASALASLDGLEAQVVTARDAGETPADEAEAVLSRIATVRADLTALVPSPTPSPQPVQNAEPTQTSAPVQSADPVPQQPAAPDENADDGTDDNNGPGTGKQPSDQQPGDKGNGRGKGDPGKKDD